MIKASRSPFRERPLKRDIWLTLVGLLGMVLVVIALVLFIADPFSQ
jgi:hypothetical protein